MMSTDTNDTVFLNLIKQTAETHGCTIVDVDFVNHIVNLDGPEEAMDECALAISKLID